MHLRRPVLKGATQDFFSLTETAESGYELDEVYPDDGLG